MYILTYILYIYFTYVDNTDFCIQRIKYNSIAKFWSNFKTRL